MQRSLLRSITRRAALAVVAAALLAGCYPRFDWRDYRPDCARGWCGFVASFPGRVTSATRDVPVGAMRLPLSLHVVSVGGLTFAVGAFEIVPGGDAELARDVLIRKLLDDVGAAEARQAPIELIAGDRSRIAATSFDASGERGGQRLRAVARFAMRDRRVVEILVVGTAEAMAGRNGAQALDTFFTSVRLD